MYIFLNGYEESTPAASHTHTGPDVAVSGRTEAPQTEGGPE